MIASILDNKWIQLSQISPHEEDVVWRQFSVAAPGRQFVDVDIASRWDGVYRFYNRHRQVLACPLLDLLRQVCREHKLPLTVRDERDPTAYPPPGPETITADYLPGITLEPYQVKAIQTALHNECGIFNLPTGSGKTEVLAGICKAIPCPTLVLADQKVVIDQIKDRLELREVASEVGMFYAGKRPNGELVVVGSIQSLSPPKRIPEVPTRTAKESDRAWQKKLDKYDVRLRAFKTRRKNAKALQQIAKKAHMVIVDECDKASGDLYKDFFRYQCFARRRYGFSGTPFDPEKPVQRMVIQQHLGSEIVREERSTVEALGRIVPIDYYSLYVDGDHREASAYDLAYREHMVESPRFWRLVAGIVSRHQDEGTLILVDREELGWNLQRAIQGLGLEAPFIFGKTPKPRRDEALRGFERRDFRVLIGGKIINRGLDLRGGCENLILATGGKLWSEFNQKLGRAVRVNQRGRGRVYDFYFRCNRYLYAHSRARLQAVVDMGYRATVVLPWGRIDGGELIRRRFRLPKPH